VQNPEFTIISEEAQKPKRLDLMASKSLWSFFFKGIKGVYDAATHRLLAMPENHSFMR
jgi:hypothetical protein